jgi:hypothetical protein
MSAPKRALCSVCQRQLAIRKDGRLRAHLATRGHRGECEGSGQFSARVTMLGSTGVRLEIDTSAESWDHMTPAQRFNAREEWAKVYALWDEFEAMWELKAAPREAMLAALEARNRAYEDAKRLAPMGVMRGVWGEDETA